MTDDAKKAPDAGTPRANTDDDSNVLDDGEGVNGESDGEEPKKRRRNAESKVLFFPVPEDALRRIRETGGRHAEIAVYTALCWAFFHAPTCHKAAFWARHTELAASTGVYVRKIGECVAILERAGLVVCKRPRGAELADRQPARYTLPALLGIAKQVKRHKADCRKTGSPDTLDSDSPDYTVRSRAGASFSSHSPHLKKMEGDKTTDASLCAGCGAAFEEPPAAQAGVAAEREKKESGDSIFSNNW